MHTSGDSDDFDALLPRLALDGYVEEEEEEDGGGRPNSGTLPGTILGQRRRSEPSGLKCPTLPSPDETSRLRHRRGKGRSRERVGSQSFHRAQTVATAGDGRAAFSDFLMAAEVSARESKRSTSPGTTGAMAASIGPPSSTSRNSSPNKKSPRSQMTPRSQARAQAKQVDDQMEEDIGALLSEMRGMSRGVDALLSKMNSSNHRSTLGRQGHSHRRKMSMSLPDLNVLTATDDRGGAGRHTGSSSKHRGNRARARSGKQPPRGERGRVGGGSQGGSAHHTNRHNNGRQTGRTSNKGSSSSVTSRRTGGGRSSRSNSGSHGGHGELPTAVDTQYGCASLAGAKSAAAPRKTKENQDSFLLHEDFPEPGGVVFAIFDGHGPRGKHVSQFCANHFVAALTKCNFHRCANDNGRGTLTSSTSLSSSAAAKRSAAACKAFHALDRQLCQQSFDTVHSGCTAVACVVIPSQHKVGGELTECLPISRARSFVHIYIWWTRACSLTCSACPGTVCTRWWIVCCCGC